MIARLWEILANKTCAFTQKYNILFPYKFTDSKNYVEYETIQEFETKIRYYLNNKFLHFSWYYRVLCKNRITFEMKSKILR